MTRKLWPGTLALAQGHLDRGQRVWLVTATPVELAAIIAARLGLTGALGTVSEIEDGVYTGRLVGSALHGKAKADAVRALAEREGLDLVRCTAYSDSANDVPMLSAVGRAVAVNPDGTLRKHARAVGWEIHDYRRDADEPALLRARGPGRSRRPRHRRGPRHRRRQEQAAPLDRRAGLRQQRFVGSRLHRVDRHLAPTRRGRRGEHPLEHRTHDREPLGPDHDVPQRFEVLAELVLHPRSTCATASRSST